MITAEEKAGLVVGFKQVKKAILSGKCKKIFLAEDANPTIINEIKSIAQNIETVFVPTMRELGTLCEIDVCASCACIKSL